MVFVMATGFVALTVALGAIMWNTNPNRDQSLYPRQVRGIPYSLVRPHTYAGSAFELKQVPAIKPVLPLVRVQRDW
jgi:hypothetical protein